MLSGIHSSNVLSLRLQAEFCAFTCGWAIACNIAWKVKHRVRNGICAVAVHNVVQQVLA